MAVKSTDPTVVIRWQQASPDARPPPGPQEPVSPEAPAPPEPLDAPWLRRVVWAMPMLIAGALGMIEVRSPGLWEDELATWGMVTTPWPEFWSVLRNVDAVIGPYYVLLRLWTQLVGTSDLLLRLPSVLAMAGAAALVAALGSRIGGLRVGLAAGVLFAVLPTTSRYAQEARPYALSVFAAALATLLLARLLDAPGFRRYLSYTGAVALLGLSHAVGLLLLPAHAIVVWRLRRRTRTLFGWLLAAALGVAPAVPVMYLGVRQADAQIDWIPPLTVGRVIDTPQVLFGGAVLAGAAVALALVAMSMRGPAMVATTWALAPAVGLAVAARLSPLWLPRYLLFTLPAWLLLAALTLRRASILRGLGAVLAIGLLGLPAQLEVRRPIGHQQGTKDIAAVLNQHAVPGDAIVYGPHAGGDQRTSRDAVQRYVVAGHRPTDALLLRPPRSDGRLGAQECAGGEVPRCLGTPERVWVVRKGALDDPLESIGEGKERLLRDGYALRRSWRIRGFTMALLVRDPTA